MTANSTRTPIIARTRPVSFDASAFRAYLEDVTRVILFDGTCNLCSASVQFVMDRDRQRRFKFASLQSPEAAKLLADRSVTGPVPDSMILIEGSQVYFESEAALRIARHLDGAWPALYGFVALPSALRDASYRVVARNRYRWFGRSDTCRVPEFSDRDRFLSE